MLRDSNNLNTKENSHANNSHPPLPSKLPLKKKALSQTHLDLGQKNFFSKRCPICGLVYTPGKEEDERLHESFHNSPLTIKYTASKSDLVVSTDGSSGNIICLQPPTTNPPKLVRPIHRSNHSISTLYHSLSSWMQLRELASLLEDQLGLLPGWLLAVPCTTYLYVCSSTRNILSCIFVEPIKTAWVAQCSNHHAIKEERTEDDPSTTTTATTDAALSTKARVPSLNRLQNTPSNKNSSKIYGVITADTSHEVKARFGIRMMWTLKASRRQGIITKLVDCARSHITRGYVVAKTELAFSQPTSEGAAFIQSYIIGSSETFLVYTHSTGRGG